MDRNKIVALIKLANNNPNENEANLAARKVCKVLAELNFPLSIKETVTVGSNPFINYRPTQEQEDFVRRYSNQYESQRPKPRAVFCTGGCGRTTNLYNINRWTCSDCLERERKEKEQRNYKRWCIKCREVFYTQDIDAPNVCLNCKSYNTP